MAYVFISGDTQSLTELSISRILGARKAKEKYTPLFYALQFGRKYKLTDHQRKEVMRMLGERAGIRGTARYFNVGVATISYWAVSQGIASEVFAIWFWPLVFFGFFNSVRFVAEHYGTPWNSGQLTGTGAVISNQVNSWITMERAHGNNHLLTITQGYKGGGS